MEGYELGELCEFTDALPGGMGVRVWNALRAAGVDSMEKLCQMSASGFLRLPNIGNRCLREVKAVLDNSGRAHRLDNYPVKEELAELEREVRRAEESERLEWDKFLVAKDQWRKSVDLLVAARVRYAIEKRRRRADGEGGVVIRDAAGEGVPDL
jgi:hypothetical protein